VAQALLWPHVGLEFVAPDEPPPPLSNDAAEGLPQFQFGALDEVVTGKDPVRLQSGLHLPIDSGELGEATPAQGVRKVARLQNDQPVRLLEFGGQLGQELVWRDADAAGQGRRDVLPDRGLQPAGDPLGLVASALLANEPERHLVHATDPMDREHRLDSLDHEVMVVGVERVPPEHQFDFRAQLPGLVDPGAGPDPEGLGLVARRDHEGRVGQHWHDRDRPAPQLWTLRLLDRREVGVEIEEQHPQRPGVRCHGW
jgi:hypothetical protein